MKSIPKNYEPPESEFGAFDDGKYKVISAEWFSVDDNDQPILQRQKDDKMVARLRFISEDKKEGPPMSVTLGELLLLVGAFADVSLLPPIPALNRIGEVTAYLELAEKLIRESEKVVEVEVKNGWVSSVKGMDLPTGMYYVRLSGLSPIDRDDGVLRPISGSYGNFFFAEFEIVAGEGGSDTPYKGAIVSQSVNYAVVIVDGEAEWATTKEGAYTQAAVNLNRLMEYSAPGIFDNWAPPDPENLLPYWWLQAKANNMVFKAYRAKSSWVDSKTKQPRSKVSFDLTTLEDAVGYKAPERAVTPDHQPNVDFDEVDEKARKLLIETLSYLSGQESIVGENYVPTEEGRPVLKRYLTPIRESGKIPAIALSKLTFDHVSTIFEQISPNILVAVNPGFTERKEKLSRIGVRLDEEVEKEPEEDECPF